MKSYVEQCGMWNHCTSSADRAAALMTLPPPVTHRQLTEAYKHRVVAPLLHPSCCSDCLPARAHRPSTMACRCCRWLRRSPTRASPSTRMSFAWSTSTCTQSCCTATTAATAYTTAAPRRRRRLRAECASVVALLTPPSHPSLPFFLPPSFLPHSLTPSLHLSLSLRPQRAKQASRPPGPIRRCSRLVVPLACLFLSPPHAGGVCVCVCVMVM
jgi:hypothetical protein